MNISKARKIYRQRVLLRNICSIAVAVATMGAIAVSAVVIPKSSNLPKYQLPMQIDLPNWRSLNQQNSSNLSIDNLVMARQYFYSRNSDDYQLQVDAIYLSKVSPFLNLVKAIGIEYRQSTLELKYAVKTGHYALFADQNKAYLATCINPTGQATLTEEQFSENQQKFMGQRLGLYLLGISDLRDYRCLFTVMSMPLVAKDSQTNYQTSYQDLEAAWLDWHLFWQQRFP